MKTACWLRQDSRRRSQGRRRRHRLGTKHLWPDERRTNWRLELSSLNREDRLRKFRCSIPGGHRSWRKDPPARPHGADEVASALRGRPEDLVISAVRASTVFHGDSIATANLQGIYGFVRFGSAETCRPRRIDHKHLLPIAECQRSAAIPQRIVHQPLCRIVLAAARINEMVARIQRAPVPEHALEAVLGEVGVRQAKTDAIVVGQVLRFLRS